MPSSLPNLSRFRGPVVSHDQNDRIQAAYEDLIRLYGIAANITAEQERAIRGILAAHLALADKATALETRIAALEVSSPRAVNFFNANVDETSDFDNTGFSVPASQRLTIDSFYGIAVLPRLDQVSSSRVQVNVGNGVQVMPGVQTKAVAAGGSDTDANVIFSGDPSDALVNDPAKTWERVLRNGNTNPATVQLYVKIPPGGNALTNNIRVQVHPLLSADLMGVEYTTNTDPILDNTDGYLFLPGYYNDARALGWVPPQTGIEALLCGPRSYYFAPQPITAVRLTIRQRNYFQESSQFLYEYGLKLLDVRYDKFAATGKAMIRLNAPTATTINNVTAVTPRVYNIDPNSLSQAVSTRTLYETALNSGVFTTTPVSLSAKVWIELTLKALSDGYSPAVSLLEVAYS